MGGAAGVEIGKVSIGKVKPGVTAEVSLATPKELEAALALFREYRRATDKFGAFHSAHEGYAVIQEELDELWGTVKLFKSDEDLPTGWKKEHLRKEALQVAAMALRFVVDCCL